MNLRSESFEHAAAIPRKHTCEGADVSPPLSWTNPPEGTASVALIVDDPDAPDPAAPERTHVHWILYNLPPSATTLQEGAGAIENPHEALPGINDFGSATYGGPCPPVGRHRYYFRLYALDVVLPPLGQPTKQQLLDAMEGHVLGRAELMGTYEKGG